MVNKASETVVKFVAGLYLSFPVAQVRGVHRMEIGPFGGKFKN